MESTPLISIGLPVSLFIIMTGIGMTLTSADFRRIALQPRGLVIGTFAQIVIMPILAFGLAWGLNLSPAMAVGLVVIAACPGGTTSNLFVLLARGNVALSILLTVSASLLTILSLPVVTGYALELFSGTAMTFTLPVGKTVAMMAGVVLLPVMIGMAIRYHWSAWALRAESWVNKLGALTLFLLVINIVLNIGAQLPALLVQAGPAALLLNGLGVCAGVISGRLARLPTADSLALGVELGVKNSTLALMVTLALLGSSEMSLPIVVYSLSMFLLGALLVVGGRQVQRSSLASKA